MIHAVGYDGAYGHGLVAKQEAHALEGSALHLIVCDAAGTVAEFLYAAVEVGIGER